MNVLEFILTNKDYIEDVITRSTYHSNAIEGSTLTYAETYAILYNDNSFKIEGKEPREIYEAINHKRALELVFENLKEEEPFDERFIKKLINSGFKPDLTIIDYFECLEHENDKSISNEYEKEGKTMRKFEAMAGELDMAIWIPSQGTKESINLELVTMDKIGGSVKKAQIAHVIMSIARTVDDIANNKATIAILKNRAGKSGKVFNNVDFNNGTCRISTDNVDEFESMYEVSKKKSEDQLKMQQEIAKMVG